MSLPALVRDQNGKGEIAPARPDLIPLLDVIFSVLACFAFLLAMSEIRPRQLPLELPSPDAVGSSLEAEVEAIEIHFDAYGALHFNGEVCSEGDLPGRLEASLAEDSSRPIRLYGDHKASHGMTARILAATTRAGARSVGIVVQPNQLENLK